MNTNVDVDAMRKDAVEIFQKGFACSESVIDLQIILKLA